MSYYDLPLEERDLIDYDLVSCLEYNTPDDSRINLDNLLQVVAIYEGERDCVDWQWVITLKSGEVAYMQAGCDYTGWDCQSWIHDECVVDTVPALLDLMREKRVDNFDLLMTQIYEGAKTKTWRDIKDREFGLR